MQTPIWFNPVPVLLILLSIAVQAMGHLAMTDPPALGSENSASPRDYDLIAPIKGFGP